MRHASPLEDMPAPCTFGDNEGGARPVVGIRSWDRSVALKSDEFRSAIQLHSRQAASGRHDGGVGISFGTHTIIINSNVTN